MKDDKIVQKGLIGMTAEEMFEEVKSLDNEERIKFLVMMYNNHFRKPSEEEIKYEEIDWE